MSAAFKKGDLVRLKTVAPQGPVQRFKMDEETGEVQYLLQWPDASGELQERWFREDELEVVPA